GTPAYLAPEQITGAPVDGRADVYSLGCLLFECLTETVPYSSDTRLGVAWAHLEEEPPRASGRRPDLPAAIDGVVRKAIAKEPEARYEKAGALIDAARDALGLGHAPARRRRGRVLIGGAALFVVLAAAIVGFVLTQKGGHAPPPLVRANSLVRIDPETSAVSRVVGVGLRPMATAAAGGSVWVYADVPRTLAEVDSDTGVIRRTTNPSASPSDLALRPGPVLAADGGGAGLIGTDDKRGGVLTRAPIGADGKRDHRLDLEPAAVAVGEGAVWIAGHADHDDEVLRVNPATGSVTA